MFYSDYTVYVDESGDHGLDNINEKFPVFGLAFCVFHKDSYIYDAIPKISSLKMKYWGYNEVVLHEWDIRKNRSGEYGFLTSPTQRAALLGDISRILGGIDFNIASTVIMKDKLSRFANYKNPYQLAMMFTMERVHNWLISKGQEGHLVTIVFESRGAVEDSELELEFRRICDNSPSIMSSSTDFKKN